LTTRRWVPNHGVGLATLCAILSAQGCTATGSGDDDDSSSTGTGEDTIEPETGEPESTTDPDTGSGTDPDSSTGETEGGDQSLLELLASVPDGTRWADLDDATRAAIEKHAADRYAANADEWGGAALVEKEATLLRASTAEIDAAFDTWAAVRLGAPEDFSASSEIADDALSDALRRAYLAEIGTQRCELVYLYPEAPLEWDGAGPLTGCPTELGEETRGELRAYAAAVHGDLAAIDDATLDETTRPLRDRALHITRALGAGSLSAWGVDELQTPWGAVAFSADPYFSWSYAPELFADGEAYIQAINAATQQPLHWVDVGTVGAALEYTFPAWVLEEEAAELLGDPTLGHYHFMLWDWWRERLEADPAATTACTAYDEGEQQRIMDGFAGNMYFDVESQMTLGDLAPLTAELSDAIAAHYRGVAIDAVDAVFPDDSVLDPQARAAVHAAIEATDSFGALADVIAGALDEATGDTVASETFAAALADVDVLSVDRNGEVPPEVAAQVQAMWTDVRAYLVASYDGYAVDYAAALPETVEVTADYGAFASPAGVTMGLGVPRTVTEAYSTMLHEAHHVVNFNADLVVEGAAIEGAAELASRQTRSDLLASVLSPIDATIGEFLLVSSDARLVGFTNATLAVLTRASCDGADTRQYATDIAASYGVSDDDLALASHRAHNGTQYLGYMTGEVIYADRLAWFSTAVGQTVTAFDLQKCAMPDAPTTDASAAALADCLSP
jgi:hypothetical protein